MSISARPVSPVAGPSARRLRAVAPAPDSPADPVTTSPMRLPEGATVLAALPQSVLPEQLLEQYGGLIGRQQDGPVVGYLVLVPACSLPFSEEARSGTAAEPPVSSRSGITVDLERRTTQVDGVPLELTYLEFQLLAHLTAHPHRVHGRDHLISAVWGYGHVGDGRTVDVHVARLRRKLGAAHRNSIVTVRRVGYKYVPVASR